MKPTLRSASQKLLIISAVAAGLAGCSANPYLTAGAAVAVGPQILTGRNTFYHVNKWFGRDCSTYSNFDLPTRCINDD